MDPKPALISVHEILQHMLLESGFMQTGSLIRTQLHLTHNLASM